MNDNERVELNEMVSAVIDGRATPAEISRLEKMLTASDEARRFYVRTMEMSASLCGHAGEMQSERPDAPKVIPMPRWTRWAAPLAAAAAVALGVLISKALFGPSAPEAGEEVMESVARLSGSKDCKWTGVALATGDELARGRRLELESGFAELTFDSGAQITLTGPAVLDLHSEWEAELHRGTLKANVPPEAVGFRVVNAAVEVVDLGTEFSMTAEDGAAEVFVLKGAVEVLPKTASGREPSRSVLREKQARRFAKAGDSEVRDGEKKFQRFATKVAVDRLAHRMNHVRWSFDEGAGASATATGGGLDAKFQNAEGAGSDLRWTDGRWGRAVEVNDTPALIANFASTSLRPVRTVAFWMRLPEQAPLSASGPLLTMPLTRAGQAWTEFSWNAAPADGVLGALRLRTASGTTVGTTALRDGRWHHVAAIVGQSSKAPQKLHVKLYVDGRFEATTTKNLIRVKPGAPGHVLADVLRIGGHRDANVAVDELVLTDRPLAPHEIRHLIRTNQLISPESLAAF